MIVRFDIQPKSDEEYKDVIDSISEFLEINNIEHRKYEIENKDNKWKQKEF
ncbi:MAG: hypothetical protein WC535_08275 [Candidatus Cloacimonas sp.]